GIERHAGEMLLAARYHQHPAVLHQHIGRRKKSIGTGREIQGLQRAPITTLHALRRDGLVLALARPHLHKAMSHRKLQVDEDRVLSDVRIQHGTENRKTRIVSMGRHPLHMLVSLTGTCRRATVVKTQAATLREHMGQSPEIGFFQRLSLLSERLASQDKMTVAYWVFVQDGDMVLAYRPDCKRGIRRKKGVEIRVARAARQLLLFFKRL